MRIITACNEAYSFFLPVLADSVSKFYPHKLIVYDMGGVKAPKNTHVVPTIPLDWKGREIELTAEGKIAKRGKELDYSKELPKIFTRPRSLYKPSVIADALERFKEPVLWVDADTEFQAKVEFDDMGADAVLTVRYEDEINPRRIYWGFLNAGVVYFKNRSQLFEAWYEACKTEELSDQGAMNKLLASKLPLARVKMQHPYQWGSTQVVFAPCAAFNDYRLDKGMIFHYKIAEMDLEKKKTIYQQKRSGQDASEKMISDLENEKNDISDQVRLIYNLVCERKPKFVVELGIRTGRSSRALLAGLRKHGGELYSCDTSEEHRATWDEIRKQFPDWQIHVCDSVDLVNASNFPPLPFVFLDTSHTYQDTARELAAIYPKLKPGGIVLVHDTKMDTVAYAMIEFLREHTDCTFRELGGNAGMGMITKEG